MRKHISVFITLILLSIPVLAKTKAKVKPVAVSKFRMELFSLIKATNKPSGFDSLKQTELGRGLWNCRIELEGFLTLITLDKFHPAERLLFSAESVNPAAIKNAKLLTLKGIPGYTMRDSDNDKTVELDGTTQKRKVIFTKRADHVQSVVTLIYAAHQYGSVKLTIEAWQTL